ncbi:MAG: PhoX family phosphatase [Rhodothermales bacterium]
MLSRRHFLKQASAYAVGFAGLQALISCTPRAAIDPYTQTNGYGPLRVDPAGLFDLPEGFSYRVISRVGDPMDDGLLVPHRPDGMATFPGTNGRTILIRNHEVSGGADADEGAFGEGNAKWQAIGEDAYYDAGQRSADPCLGGTSTVIYNTATQEVEGQFLSLAGTIRNCAGGPTPWNSWLTCEETTERAGDRCRVDHGYVFEVPATMTPELAAPVALKAMGRFNHEAVAVDPASGIVYQTEDAHDGLIYRFIPNVPGQLAEGGRLQALVVVDQPSLDTRNWGDGPTIPTGQTMAVRWIDMTDVESPNDDLRLRGFADGAARFARGEGMWYGNDAVFFACTNGGDAKKGQIWRYIPSPHEGTAQEAEAPGRLDLFVEPNDGDVVDNADNLTVAPWGDLIVCEDGSGDQFLVGVTPEGELYKFARNAGSDSELAGVTFSPDGTTLFVNIQHTGQTLAITGPWQG